MCEDLVEIKGYFSGGLCSLIFQHLPRYLTPGFYFLILLEFSIQLSITNSSSADSNTSCPPPFSMLGNFLSFFVDFMHVVSSIEFSCEIALLYLVYNILFVVAVIHYPFSLTTF